MFCKGICTPVHKMKPGDMDDGLILESKEQESNKETTSFFAFSSQFSFASGPGRE